MTTITTRDEALDFMIEIEMNYLNCYKVIFDLKDTNVKNANDYLNTAVKKIADMYSLKELTWIEFLEDVRVIEKNIKNKI